MSPEPAELARDRLERTCSPPFIRPAEKHFGDTVLERHGGESVVSVEDLQTVGSVGALDDFDHAVGGFIHPTRASVGVELGVPSRGVIIYLLLVVDYEGLCGILSVPDSRVCVFLLRVHSGELSILSSITVLLLRDVGSEAVVEDRRAVILQHYSLVDSWRSFEVGVHRNVIVRLLFSLALPVELVRTLTAVTATAIFSTSNAPLLILLA